MCFPSLRVPRWRSAPLRFFRAVATSVALCACAQAWGGPLLLKIELTDQQKKEAFDALRRFAEGVQREEAEEAAQKKEAERRAAEEQLRRDQELVARRAKEIADAMEAKRRADEVAVVEQAKAAARSIIATTRNPAARDTYQQFVFAADNYLAAGTERECRLTARAIVAGQPEHDVGQKGALDLAHERVASMSRDPSKVRFTSSHVECASSRGASDFYYHAWGDLESLNQAGGVVTARWCVILVSGPYVEKSTGKLLPASTTVGEGWKAHVVVWDVQLKSK